MKARSSLTWQSPLTLRHAIRQGSHRGPTTGCCDGKLQGNLVILPAEHAEDFANYCNRNPQPLPLLARSTPGNPALPLLGVDIDIRRDVPGFCVFRGGRLVAQPDDLIADWRNDLVSFVLGCSFSFEAALIQAGIPMRHIAAGRNIAMYRTTLATRPVGPFSGPLVVSLRGIPAARVAETHRICASFPLAHGAPIHTGDPAQIGIPDLDNPDWGDPPVITPGDIPVFWACGVTGQQALQHAALPFAITHQPGHMLVTDLDAATTMIGAKGLA